MIDFEIYVQFKSGNPEPLYINYGPMARAHVMKNQGTQEEAEDHLQDTMLEAWQKIDSFNYTRDGSFKNWFMSIVKNRWIDKLRKPTKTKTVRRENEDQADSFFETLQISNEKEKDIKALHAALKLLDEYDRRILHLKYFEGKSSREIVDILALETPPIMVEGEDPKAKENTLNQQQHTARKNLKKFYIIEREKLDTSDNDFLSTINLIINYYTLLKCCKKEAAEV